MPDQERTRWTRLVADFETSDLAQREFATERGISFSNLRERSLSHGPARAPRPRGYLAPVTTPATGAQAVRSNPTPMATAEYTSRAAPA